MLAARILFVLILSAMRVAAAACPEPEMAGVDSTLIRLIRMTRHETFEIVLRGGDTLNGRIKLKANGVEVSRRIILPDGKRGAEKMHVPWEEIKLIRPTPAYSSSGPRYSALLYFVGAPLVAIALFFWRLN